jgi:hypothetical protein
MFYHFEDSSRSKLPEINKINAEKTCNINVLL